MSCPLLRHRQFDAFCFNDPWPVSRKIEIKQLSAKMQLNAVLPSTGANNQQILVHCA